MRLVCLMLMGVLAAQDLQTGESRQPKMKRKFNLSYYDLPKIDTTEIRGKVLVSFSVDEDGRVIQPEIIDTFNMKLNDIDFNKLTKKVARTGNYECYLPTITNKVEAKDSFLANEWHIAQKLSLNALIFV